MQYDSIASAPGKILWLGGYSVLERPNIGLVTTVDAHVATSIRLRKDASVSFHAPQLNAYAEGRMERDGIIRATVDSKLGLLKIAAEVTARYATVLGIKPMGMDVYTHNDPQFSYEYSGGRIAKSGLGSSAAVTVATIYSIMNAYGLDPYEHDSLHKLAHIAHSIATGKVGSGFDIAAAVYGSIIYTRYSPKILDAISSGYENGDLQGIIKKKWDYRIEKFVLPALFKMLFANFVGTGMVTTRAIGSVSKFKEENPLEYKKLVRMMNDENIKAVNELRSINNGNDEERDLEGLRLAFDRGRELAKELGVLSGIGIEDDDLSDLIKESEDRGAFVAKLPGAGGRDAIAALATGNAELRKLRKFWSAKKTMHILNVKISNKGVL